MESLQKEWVIDVNYIVNSKNLWKYYGPLYTMMANPLLGAVESLTFSYKIKPILFLYPAVIYEHVTGKIVGIWKRVFFQTKSRKYKG